jgi:outer membrane lipoprotein SlyB
MSSRIRQTVSFALVLAMLSMGLVAAHAQRRPYRMTDRQVDEMIRRVETSADRFRATLANALDRSTYDGTRTEDDINRFVQSFESATDQLRDRFNRRVSVAADVENVLRQASDINQFMLRNRLTQRAQSDWSLVRNDLNALAQAYGVGWQWNQQGTFPPPAGSTVPSRVNDQQVAAIIRRIENRTDTFRAALERGLDRSIYDGTRAENNINQFIRDFETATDALRDRFNSRRSVASDVENVLRRAASVDEFMRRNQLNQRAENQWSLLRTDLGELATAYNVAWNWDSTNTFPTPGGGYTANNRLTGTYRLDPSRSDNARDIAERAARNLPAGERQRVSERLASRLESPDMLAIERTGSRVTIASSRAPQTTFDADGRVSNEQLPNGRASRVTASLSGERLTVRSAGFRENDFTVTFEPVNNGRQLQVTREIWNDRLGNTPIVVRNVYDRTSDVADFGVYNGSTASTYPPTTGGAYGDYAIRDGEMIVAAMNTDLTSRTTQTGDRFTMTVREPAQYRGAVIEGRVANVSRSGRVTGRSEMALDFENIRMPDGRTYRFAGFIETVRTPNGETVRVDNEGTVRDDDSRGTTTAQRAAIGTAVGAIIGAIAGGGKGAAIGAIVGAGAGAGSVYVQGREDIELLSGTELTIRASAPNR